MQDRCGASSDLGRKLNPCLRHPQPYLAYGICIIKAMTLSCKLRFEIDCLGIKLTNLQVTYYLMVNIYSNQLPTKYHCTIHLRISLCYFLYDHTRMS